MQLIRIKTKCGGECNTPNPLVSYVSGCSTPHLYFGIYKSDKVGWGEMATKNNPVPFCSQSKTHSILLNNQTSFQLQMNYPDQGNLCCNHKPRDFGDRGKGGSALLPLNSRDKGRKCPFMLSTDFEHFFLHSFFSQPGPPFISFSDVVECKSTIFSGGKPQTLISTL